MDAFNIVILGIIISIIFYELTEISPGGIIVPGFLVMYINQPLRLIYTILISLLAYLIYKLLSKYMLIYGKRRFVFLILISLFINIIFMFIFNHIDSALFAVSLIGYTIPGIIASDYARQGIKKTLPAMFIVLGILECIVLIAY